MEFEKGLFDGEKIPDFALQPAKPASSFDPTVYDKLFETMRQQALATGRKEPAEEEPFMGEVAAEVAKAEPESEPEAKAEPVMAEIPAEATGAETEPEPEDNEEAVMAEIAVEVAETEPEPEKEPSDLAVAAAIPVLTVHPVQKPLSPKAETLSDRKRSRRVKFTDFRTLNPVMIHVEEDILITDAKPDMIQMLSVEGSCRLAERNSATGAHGIQSLRIAGDLVLQALYTAENDQGEPALVSLDNKILFREDCIVKTEPDSILALSGELSSLDWERINERKFRVRADIQVSMREYGEKELDLFEGMEGEDLQVLEGEIQFAHVAMRKTEIGEVSEDLRLKEGSPEIDKILCYNLSLAENHKQVTGEKAMINAAIYLNLLYKSAGHPVFQRLKTDFTQFMRMDESEFDHPLLGGNVCFNVLECSLAPKRDEDGNNTVLSLNMDVETTLEYYGRIEEPCISDLYHYSKDVEFNRSPQELKCFCGSGEAHIPIREMIHVPDGYGKADQIVYISGSPVIKKQEAASGKVTVEGTLPVRLVCIGGESGMLPFTVEEELDFRASLDMPDLTEGSEPDCRAILKDLRFDSINERQIAVNAEILVSGYAFGKTRQELIRTVHIRERGEEKGPSPAIIVYAAKEGDTVWKVAKKYHAPISRIRAVNDLADHEEIRAGSKVLIVR